MTNESLARRLRVLRAALGITLAEAEELTGVTRETLGALEHGQRGAYTSTLEKIAKGYGTTVSALLEEDPEANMALAGSPKAEAPPAGPQTPSARTEGEPALSEKTDPPAGVGELSELLDRLGTRSKNLADPQLVSSLEGASDAAVRRTVRETRRELALLLPELRRLGDELKPGDDGYMTYNKALSWASQQVLALKFFLLAWNEPEPQEDAVALQSLSRELIGIGMGG